MWLNRVGLNTSQYTYSDFVYTTVNCCLFLDEVRQPKDEESSDAGQTQTDKGITSKW